MGRCIAELKMKALLINYTFGRICRGKLHLPCDKALIFGRIAIRPYTSNFMF
ncbi:hypothetical protein [Moraxella lacunata]|uniref:hypothetical protein n=1 Tax=Moraxella lacunata TaxID=477 RepID=UPI003EE2E245